MQRPHLHLFEGCLYLLLIQHVQQVYVLIKCHVSADLNLLLSQADSRHAIRTLDHSDHYKSK